MCFRDKKASTRIVKATRLRLRRLALPSTRSTVKGTTRRPPRSTPSASVPMGRHAPLRRRPRQPRRSLHSGYLLCRPALRQPTPAARRYVFLRPATGAPRARQLTAGHVRRKHAGGRQSRCNAHLPRRARATRPRSGCGVIDGIDRQSRRFGLAAHREAVKLAPRGTAHTRRGYARFFENEVDRWGGSFNMWCLSPLPIEGSQFFGA